MEAFGLIGAFLGGLVVLYLLGLLFVFPVRLLWKLLLNGIVGFLLLLLVNLIGGPLFDFRLALNPLNALIAGFLGVPGVSLLIILSLIL